jgi:glucose/arabinose dehydrogenase
VIGEDEPGEYPRWGQGPDFVGDPCPKPGDADVDACPVSGRLVRLTAIDGPGGYEVAEAGGEVAEEVLVEDWCQQFSSHSIGDLAFAADGSLYVSGGDGASFNVPDYGQYGWPQRNQCGDPPGDVGDELGASSAEGGALRSQDLLTPATPGDPTGLSGTVIRIDPDSGEGLPGNLLFGSFDANERRIVAFGLRNPFRLALDEAHGDLYVANVGWAAYEEIDRFPVLPSGAPTNSGWPCFEGPGRNGSYASLGLDLCEGLYLEPGATAPPFFFYRHGTSVLPGDGCSAEPGSAVAALHVYPGGTFPGAYEGALFFADTVRGCIYVIYPGENGRPDPETTELFLGEGGIYPGADLFTGPEGNLFYLKFYGEEDEGSLHRVSYDPEAPVARLEASPEWGAQLPLQVELDASASTDPGGEPLEYDWDLDGDRDFEVLDGSAQETATYADDENVRASVRVSDGTRSSVARVTVYPGDTPPQPVIAAPLPDFTWRVGENVEFSGYGSDAEEENGKVDEADLRWKTQLYHCPLGCHAHPLQVFPGTSFGEFTAPDHDWPARIELRLTATDSRGLSATTAVEILPRTVDLTIASYPPGLEVSAGLQSKVAPFDLRVIEGSNVVLSAPPTALVEGAELPWLRWSNGSARVHTLVAERSRTYTAFYREPPPEPRAPDDEEPEGKPAAPRTILRKRPPARSASTTATFAFKADQPGASFRCKLDGKPTRPCRSPRTYRNLAPGRHVHRVQAVAGDGTAEPGPVAVRWRIEPGAKPRPAP